MAPPSAAGPLPPPGLTRNQRSDPYPYFAWLREHAPVHREQRSGGHGVWLVSRHADVRALLADPRLSKRPALVPGYVPGPAGLNSHVLHTDPPDHTRLRRLISTELSPRNIAQLAPTIRTTATGLLERIQRDTYLDVIADFAAPLTFQLVCTVLGVPERWHTPAVRTALKRTLTLSAEQAAGAQDGGEAELRHLLRELIAYKRRHGQDSDQDLLHSLVRARDEDGQLSEEELHSTAYLLLLVGHDTTMNLIGNGMLALLQHPDEKARLHNTPALIGTAVEELLRYDSPARDATFHAAATPIELHGYTIGRGDIVRLLIGSANRDRRQFAEPDRLDLARRPNDHLSFGHGPHFCVGAALSRLEASIAFPLLLERLGPVSLARPPGKLVWQPARVMRGLTALPLVRRGRPATPSAPRALPARGHRPCRSHPSSEPNSTAAPG